MTPGFVEVASPPLPELEAELRLRSLVDFVPHLSPTYMRPAHLAPLLASLQRAVEGGRERVLCSAPPRHAKTESVLHVPAFALRRRPDMVLGYVTYADRLARSKSRRARALAVRAGVQLEAKAINEWRTKEGGGLLAGGVGGPLTGHGLHLLVIDDPCKSRLEAESATYRERLEDWFRDVATTRVEPGGSIFIFATRWTQDDLIGTLAKEAGWAHLNLPAIGADGAALWPERWPLAELELKRADVGEYTWASLYQGEPRARGAAVFNDVRTYETLPTTYAASGGLDVAYTAKTSSDRSCAVVMLHHLGRCYVVDCVSERLEPELFKRRVAVLQRERPNLRWRWYAAGPELGGASFLRASPDAVDVVARPAKGDKFTRAISYAAAWNRGDVLLPRKAPWLSRFVAVHAGFTGTEGGEDDEVDAAVAAWDEGQGSTEDISTRVPRARVRGLAGERM